ncbi:type II secretion system F family protein [Heyndrickxia oleronia]|jgi:tight adherence protein C|uniref:type II secretion system F family protein n=1 Tax=Heyndrickxia oleronia TaxID=38875 RepID=UPI00203F9474|nr:type II secretion system F family protein [Heyndrickxia oleronia]MCI1591752.1 type II secretion system F family protein [Heyndrickxia oleronia]MCI1614952.1 type II secretion system F family protein [Heyndrickxia oleronia]MCI1745819.1 type II secretion system F family protein [Heyndrickxia oleronia]MCI1763718.1 type II secretion system F family protein [Heyndrickxia oleronia]MCM3241018.1 type II secretion system F family protein [Heyndrickxia oleronia]
MDALIILMIILFWFTIWMAVRHYYVFSREKRELLEHISDVTYTDVFEKKTKKKNRRGRLIQKLTKYAEDFSDLGQRVNFFSENHDVENWLRKSGNSYNLTVERFQGLKIFLLIVGFFGGVLSLIIGLPFSQYSIIFLPILGYFLPIIVVRNQAKKRQQLIRKDLPDFLDTISTSLQAGINLDQALREVIRFFDGPLREEFSRFNYEIELGVQRETAYRNLLSRNDNTEFQSLIKSLIQGQNLGVPIATTFKIQAEDMRKLREEQVKELAAKASPKVTLVTTFIVAPVSILMIAGLMILNMIYGENSIFNMLQ